VGPDYYVSFTVKRANDEVDAIAVVQFFAGAAVITLLALKARRGDCER
jgi:hypothetical protein